VKPPEVTKVWMAWLVIASAARADELHGVPAAGPFEATVQELPQK
jgi:hypothetical protein